MEMWLGELSDSLGGDLKREVTDDEWRRECETVAKIAAFAQRIEGL